MSGSVIRGVHVFWSVATFFAAVIAVDVYFVASAVQTFPGEEVKNSYVLGLEYNHEVERRQAQERLGWQAEAGLRDEGGRKLVVRFERAPEILVTSLIVSANVRLIGRDGEGRTIALQESSPGEYVAPVSFTGPGRVELTISARRRGQAEPVFEAVKTLVIS
jgi:nitrogen fixation protein FixH